MTTLSARSDAHELKSINDEITRINRHLLKLRQQKKVVIDRLVDYMQSHDLKEFQGIKLRTIQPKSRKQTKAKKERRKDGIAFFKQIGAYDPEDLWKKFEQTQTK